MKFNIKKVLILTSLGIIFALLLTNSSTNTSNEQENNENTIDMQDEPNLKHPKISGAYTEPFIHIDGNWSDAIGKPWFSGDGTSTNPYVIENVTIDATSSPTGSGIFIENSKNEYFIIKNCTVYLAVDGIMLENTNNGRLTRNVVSYSETGIRLSNNCDDNIISENGVIGNAFGIILETNCDDNVISGNAANNNYYGISIHDNCDDNWILGNYADSNFLWGISIGGNCDNNTISGNTANDNQFGIGISNDCDNNWISGNTMNDNSVIGIIMLDYCNDNWISGNTANDNGWAGIRIINSYDNNTISGNTANNNYYGIILANNSDNNWILGNTANNNYYGIILETNCDNNTISENTANDNQFGIYIYNDCDDNIISENTAIYNINDGILLETNCDNNIISENYATSNFDIGIILADNCDDNIISENVAAVARVGIVIADNCDNNTISGNNVGDCFTGISISDNCDDNIISGNKADGNNFWGISIGGNCDNNIISGNTANYNRWGIDIGNNCDDNIISENTASDNLFNGIILFKNCDNNFISGNTANDNEFNGIVIGDNCDNNIISGNTANNNGYVVAIGNGIVIADNCDDNIISKNTASYNTNDGILLETNCDNNIISKNTASYNTNDGILLETNCDDNTISGNFLYENTGYGIEISVNCFDNLIFCNCIFNNTLSNANDDGQNDWDNGVIGNYWGDYNGIDANHDGIGDTPYTIPGGGGNKDYKPLMNYNPFFSKPPEDLTYEFGIVGHSIKWIVINTSPRLLPFNVFRDGTSIKTGLLFTYVNEIVINVDGLDVGTHGFTIEADDGSGGIFTDVVWVTVEEKDPIITINAPSMNQEFGEYSLGFDVSIEGSTIVSMWYTLDGGLTNTTFTELIGIIDQDLWLAQPNGLITIRFYAEDTEGDIGHADVIVIKNVEDEVVDPITPIIIINAPTMNQEFGEYSLGFDISIEGSTIVSMWYTLDGGLTNITFTELIGIIDQDLWLAQPNGLITIRFYAEDTEGDIGHADVIVIKNVEKKPKDNKKDEINMNDQISSEPSGNQLLLLFGGISAIGSISLMPLIKKRIFK
ncbi:MAG: NosD domain-containing protein [Promethearchaeota archaeon]